MAFRSLLLASAIVALTALPGRAQESLVTYKLLSPEIALDSPVPRSRNAASADIRWR